MRLQGKLALVTGGSNGIGLSIAEVLVREAAELRIVGRDPDKPARACEQLGASVKLAVAADLATERGVNEVVRASRLLAGFPARCAPSLPAANGVVGRHP